MQGHLNVRLIIFVFFKLRAIDVPFSTNCTPLFTNHMQFNQFFNTYLRE